jgi:hypothetical protein
MTKPIGISSSSTGQKRKGQDDTSAFASHAKIVKKKYVEQEKGDIEYVMEFKTALGLFSSTCAICYMAGKRTIRKHGIMQCGSKGEDYMGWKRSLRYGREIKACYFCHVPQHNDELHGTFSRGQECEYADILPCVAYGIWKDSEVKMMAVEEFGMEWANLREFGEWLTSSDVVSGHDTNMAGLFMWYCKKMYNL